jgi:DNA-binding XRE family transcriptional regulator
METAKCNTHGDRLNPNDKKRIALEIASSGPECRYTESALADKLGITRQTVNVWITDIRARQKTNRDSIIIRLSRLGWTHEKIAEKIGLSRNRITEIVGKANFCNIDILLSQGRNMNYIASHYNMKNSKPTATMAFLNADWRDFESTPAAQENTDKAITTYDYHRLLSATGWKITHRIECPLSSERMTGNMVKKMQDRRILGTTSRTLHITKKV